ncbi:Ohr family peroxiredoxin [Kitasatospora sp. NPDC059463]|uniref:Ohr family peroxiredoxin n=1 Tax=unclassified Kitasatospora TaxID=2633591 RepID=UPI0036C83B43
MAVTYTAVVDVDGEGRNGGRVRSSDGLLETALAIPKEFGGAGTATNPEQLLAAGWAACFLGALRLAAGARGIRLTSTAVTAEITLTHGDDGEFGLSAVLNPVLGGVDQATAEELARAAHRTCPYSKATRDNIPVTVNARAAGAV